MDKISTESVEKPPIKKTLKLLLNNIKDVYISRRVSELCIFEDQVTEKSGKTAIMVLNLILY